METLEIVFESEEKIKLEKVTELLISEGLQYKSVKRGNVERPIIQTTSSCCGHSKKKIKVEVLKPTFKDRLMVWSYKHISKCLFCAGMRIGIFIGIWLGIVISGIFIINKW